MRCTTSGFLFCALTAHEPHTFFPTAGGLLCLMRGGGYGNREKLTDKGQKHSIFLGSDEQHFFYFYYIKDIK